MPIRAMSRADFEAFWSSFERIIKAQDTYALAPDMTLDAAYRLWCETPLASYGHIEDGKVLGTYYLKANAAGPGGHVCNCGYMVALEARGQGIARALCEHSQQLAKAHGFRAMQFNSVVSTNELAVRLWQKLGYAIVGTVPEAFRHAARGYVDTHVMYKRLA